MIVLIVDDDFTVRQSILQRVDWKALKIDDVLECEDSREALTLCRETQPDILISDICMPKMTGIELVSEIQKFLPKLKTIFISGYSDREYLKAAIKLQAVDFIEKPINIEELTKTVKYIIDEIHEIKAQVRRAKFLEEFELRSYIEKISLQLTTKNTTPDSIAKLCSECGLTLSESNCYFTVLVKCMIEKKEEPAEKIDLNHEIICTLACQAAKSLGFKVLYGCKDTVTILHVYGIIENRYSYSSTRISLFCKNLSDKIAENNIEAIIGVGQVVSQVQDIYDSYSQSVLALQQAFYNNTQNIFYYRNAVSVPYEYNTSYLSDFDKAMSTGNQVLAKAILKELTEIASKQNNTLIQHTVNFYYEVAYIVFSLAQKQRITLLPDLKTKQQLFLRLMDFNFLRDLDSFLCQLIDAYFNNYFMDDYDNDIVNTIVRFIKKNYMDINLSISLIGDVVNLAPNYISSIFKSYTGTSINKYMTDIRMKKAKILLLNEKLTIEEISQSIGLNNGNYFAKLFQKQYSTTPSEYRRENMGEYHEK